MLASVNLGVTHTYRESNADADMLANIGVHCQALTWWDDPPLDIASLLSRDNNDFSSYHVIILITRCFSKKK